MHDGAALCALKAKDGRRYGGLTVLELERALLWGGLRYHAWALGHCGDDGSGGLLLWQPARAQRDGGGYATLQLERLYAWHYQQSELRRKRYAGNPFDDNDKDRQPERVAGRE